MAADNNPVFDARREPGDGARELAPVDDVGVAELFLPFLIRLLARRLVVLVSHPPDAVIRRVRHRLPGNHGLAVVVAVDRAYARGSRQR